MNAVSGHPKIGNTKIFGKASLPPPSVYIERYSGR